MWIWLSDLLKKQKTMKKYFQILFAVLLICITVIGQAQSGVPAVILPSPTQYSTSGGGTHCAGTVTPHIWIMQTDPASTGTLYFLWREQLPNDVLVATISGNGGSYDFGSQPDGSYYVTAMLPTGCTATMIGSVTVTPLPIPTVSISHTGSLTGCGSVTTTLSTPYEVNTSYQWYKDSVAILGATSNTYTATVTNGTEVFVCVATNTSGCTNNDFVVVTAHLLPATFVVSSPNPNNHFCEQTSGVIDLSGSMSGTTYTITGSSVPVAGTGSALQWNTGITTTGSYTVTATTSYGCTATMGSVYMVMDPRPVTANIITGPTTVCANSVVPYTTANILYADSCIWSVPNGATILSGQGTTNITVQMGTVGGAVGVYGKNDCGNGQPTTINVTINQAPTLNATANPATLCAGNSTTLTASGSAATYNWSSGLGTASTVNIIPNATTTYIVTATGSNGCVSTDDVTVTVHPLPNVTLNLSPTSICQETYSVTLSGGSPAGGTYYGGCIYGANTVFGSTVVGTYPIEYRYTDTYGCEGVSPTVLFVVNPTPTAVLNPFYPASIIPFDEPPFIVTQYGVPNGGVFNGPGFYQVGNVWWFDASQAGQGYHSATYEYTQGSTGCVGAGLGEYTVGSPTGIADNDASGILIYPNPTNDVVNINLGDINGADIQLCDVTGKMIYSGTETSIDLTDMPAGVYTLKVITSDGTMFHSKVVKN